ncbi:MAG TPA: hypothetical protein VGV90_01330 [Solirubrobacteraceae bacterium]|nr:hypothetical protein [Solirubrobacteraceae bacterium]
MDVAVMLVVAIIAVALLGTFYYALWRGWRHASGDMTPAERRSVVSGLAALVLLIPFALAVLDASDRTANFAIGIGLAAVIPVLIIVGMRDYRRREGRIQMRRHGPSRRGR